ncbi:GNAT family N-acetyltransferase [Paucibacter sp. AS339]|uniref:GNAT family N-acetyltransferase n=1 Tax=Paucibacter hankyongi TaxID=3133434 RepID=UPI0030A1EEEE
MTVLNTQRLRLEPCTDAHLEGLYALNSDPEVMRYITGKPETREGTQAMIDRVKARWVDTGYSWWSFIDKENGQIIGAGCIQHLARDVANPLEIGWRLRKDRWHQGFASEAAQGMASFAFDTLKTDLLVSVCDPANTGSSRVMERLGMSYRGLERWYDMDTSVYQMSDRDWLARQS